MWREEVEADEQGTDSEVRELHGGEVKTKPVLYLAGPINGCSDAEANDWRAFVREKLDGLYDFLDPMRRDYRGREMEPGIAAEIVQNDMADIQVADVIFANCPKPSVGTSMEVFYAKNVLHKPIIVIAPTPLSPWLKHFSDFRTSTLLSAVTYAHTIRKRL